MPTRHLLAIFALLVACKGEATKADDTPKEIPVSYESAADRLLQMSDSGWVVSRYDDGTTEHLGDSLLFTGIAMGVLDCRRGAVPEAALADMFRRNGYQLWRHPSIPAQWSLDGAIAVYWGASKRMARCPESITLWSDLLQAHRSVVSLPPSFDVLLDQVVSEATGGARPSSSRRGTLGSEVAGWALATVSQKAAAYRVHLGFLTLDVVSAPNGKVAFCEAIKDAKLQLAEQFCGRPGLSEWIQAFRYDQAEYALQRAVWESETVAPGLHTPGLDYLMAISR